MRGYIYIKLAMQKYATVMDDYEEFGTKNNTSHKTLRVFNLGLNLKDKLILDGSQESVDSWWAEACRDFVISRILLSSEILENARGLKILDTAGEILYKLTSV